MTTALRSQGWVVRPSFVVNGPTSPVTLLSDETSLTQLAGEPAVAWQTPWSEFTNVVLVRFSHSMALFATTNGVRYCWRKHDLGDFEDVRQVVLEHGGTIERKRRRVGVVIVAIVVLSASLAGGLGALLNGRSSGARELADARAVNLTLKDLPSGWSVSSTQTCSAGSPLSCLFPSSSKVFTSTTVTTTAPAKNSIWSRVTALFQSCLGVSNAKDRVYGAAGQQPDYQVSSPVFDSSSFAGTQVASTAQYYHTTQMVRKDTAEMSRSAFASCFTTSNAALLLGVYGQALPTKDVSVTWRPVTFAKGWSRAGVATITLPGAGPLHLVMAVATAGHYEVTLGALVGQWPEAKGLVANLVNTLVSRITSTSSLSA